MTELAVPSIHAQADAIELLTVNHAGSVEILRGLVARGKRSPEELAIKEHYLPALRAAVRTMRYIHAHADEIRSDLRLPLTTGASGDAEPNVTKRSEGDPY